MGEGVACVQTPLHSPPEKSEAWEGRSSYTLKPVNSASRSRPPNKPPLYGDLFYYWFLSCSIVGVSLKSVRYSRLRLKDQTLHILNLLSARVSVETFGS